MAVYTHTHTKRLSALKREYRVSSTTRAIKAQHRKPVVSSRAVRDARIDTYALTTTASIPIKSGFFAVTSW